MTVVAFVVGYLVGSIPFAYLIGALRGVDVRREGSGNVGTENVARLVGISWAVVSFVLDAGKALAVLGATVDAADPVRVAAALGVIVGHDWPVWLRFVGGRGELVTLVGGAFLAPRATAAVLALLGIGLFWRPLRGEGKTRLAEAWFVGASVYPLLAWIFDGERAALYAFGAAALTMIRRLQGSPLLARRGDWRARLVHDRDRP